MLANVDRDVNVDPPLHTANLLSGLAITFTLIDLGALYSISLRSLSPMPSNIVVPPERMMF
jgi:hypothetical protein